MIPFLQKYLPLSREPANITRSKSTIRTKSEICSQLTLKTPERRRSNVFIFNLDQFSHLGLVLQLLILNKKLFPGEGYIENTTS